MELGRLPMSMSSQMTAMPGAGVPAPMRPLTKSSAFSERSPCPRASSTIGSSSAGTPGTAKIQVSPDHTFRPGAVPFAFGISSAPAGSSARSFSTSSLTASTVATVLAFDCL